MRSPARLQVSGSPAVGGLLLLGLSVLATCVAAQEGQPLSPEAVAITLDSPMQTVRFEPLPADPGAGKPWLGQAEFTATVLSMIPVWGVSIDEAAVRGPRGRVPPDRLAIAMGGPGAPLRPLRAGEPLAIGDPTSPAELRGRLEFRPRWCDPAGPYEIRMTLRSFAPMTRDPAAAEAEQAVTLGRSGPIVILADVPEVVSISVSGGSLSFPGVLGPGRYEADREIAFAVSTNAARWAVVCHAAPLQGPQGGIPNERLFWERRDPHGRLLASGSLAEGSVVMQGDAPVEGLEGRLTFAVQVQAADLGGDYQGEVSLTGMALP
ncbi:MAG: hypothetical protein FJY75_11660 [Candidatus Eisenbacteria bacterium]|uniref:Uncharacterized protein n=1 Tax=Eiseniibacteriota bacterium TaxID=2212470 RepID=A0A938BRN0_UNCEI|nr:hypothetical protein [Candidatus Eisenbacteria bacterium]